MHALVTGATGFVGSWLTERLINDGWAVRCVARSSSSLEFIRSLPVELVYGDLRSDEIAAEHLNGVTHVFHLAAVLRTAQQRDYFHSNELATRRLLDACVRYAPRLERFILVSSQAAAGPSTPARATFENDRPSPVSNYGRSKLAAECLCLEYGLRLPITILRPSAVYGPRDRALFHYFRQVCRGIRLSLGFRDRRLSIVHVYDLVDGIILAATHARAVGQTYFLTNLQPQSWSDLGRAIVRAIRRRAIPVILPAWTAFPAAAAGEMLAKFSGKPALLNFDKLKELAHYDWVCSAAKAHEQLGFEPSLSLHEGVNNTVEWYRRKGWL